MKRFLFILVAVCGVAVSAARADAVLLVIEDALDIPPSFSDLDCMDGFLSDPKLASDVGASFAIENPVANLDYDGSGEFGCGMLFSCFVEGAAFGFHVPHVVGLGSKEKMPRIHAPRNVAFVAYENPLGNWPLGDDPCKTTRHDGNAPEPEIASPLWCGRAIPHPAALFRGNGYVTPEAGDVLLGNLVISRGAVESQRSSIHGDSCVLSVPGGGANRLSARPNLKRLAMLEKDK